MIDKRIPKEWHPAIEFLESIKDEKAAFVEEMIENVNKGIRNPPFFIKYLADNLDIKGGINKKIENYLQKINLSIDRLDKINTNKYIEVEDIQKNLMKQNAILTNLKKDLNIMCKVTKQFIFKGYKEEDIKAWSAYLRATIESLKDLRKKISQERGGFVQSKLIEAALNGKG